MSTIWATDGKKNKHKLLYKFFFESLREHGMDIINFEKEKIISLTNEQKKESYMKSQKSVAFAKISCYKTTLKIKTIVKLRPIFIIQVNTEVLHIKYVI